MILYIVQNLSVCLNDLIFVMLSVFCYNHFFQFFFVFFVEFYIYFYVHPIFFKNIGNSQKETKILPMFISYVNTIHVMIDRLIYSYRVDFY